VNPVPHLDPDATPLYTAAFWVACAIHFTGAMSHGIFLLFPLFVRHLGGDELTIGLALGTGTALSVAFRPVIGSLLDRFGRRTVLVWSGVVNVLSFPLFLLLDAPGPWLFVLTALNLVAGGALFASYFTYAADLVPPGRRVEGIAIFGVAGMAPNGLGPSLAEAVLPRAGWPGFFLSGMAFAAVSVALTLLVARPATTATEPRVFRPPGLRDVARLAAHDGLGRLLIATVLFGVGINAAFYFVAPFTRDLGIARAAPFYAAYASTTILLRIFGRRLPDRIGPHRVAIPSFAVFALGLGALVLLPHPGVLVLAGIACGSGHGSLFPVLNGLVVSRTPLHLRGAVVSLHTAALDLGAVLGTPLCGAIAHAAGYRPMFALMAVASVAGLALMATDRRR
jgi:MFS family permease